MAIVKITFQDLEGNPDFTMMFGDSYKSWREQYREFSGMYKGRVKAIRASKSVSKWKGFGGLKWCPESEFQNELNRENVQDGEPNNPKPRKYSRMRFKEFAI